MNKRHAGLGLLLAIVAGYVHGAEPLGWGKSDAIAVEVSMTELLASGDRFSGWLVSVVGVLEYSGDKDFLYLNREAYSNHDYASAIGIIVDDAVESGLSRRSLQESDGKFVRIEGRFRPYQRHQLEEDQVRIGLPVAGAIESVTYIGEIKRRR